MALSCAWIASSVPAMSRSFSNVRSLLFVIHFLRISSWSVPNTRVFRPGYAQFWITNLASVMKASNGRPFCLRLRR